MPVKARTLQMEHSLVSISKWESKWCKSYFSTKDKTTEEVIDYIRCMTITQNVKNEIYNNLTNDNIETVSKYIVSPMSATFFNDIDNSPSKEIITSEIIYYWMIALNIPFECQKWHLNKLMTLIRVCDIKNQPPKKRSQKEIMSRNAALNAARRKRLNSKG